MTNLSEASTKASYRSFVKRLVASAVLINLLLGILAGMSLYHQLSQDEADAVVTTNNICQILEQNITATFREGDQALLTIKDEYEQQLAAGALNENKLNNLITKQHSHLHQFDSLRIADANGTITYGIGVQAGSTASASDRDYFVRLRGEALTGLVMAKPVLGKISKKWVLIIARRLNRPDGSFAGVVYGAVLLESFSKMFTTINLGQGSVISLRDDGMGLIARHPETDLTGKAIGQRPVSKELQKLLAEGRTEASYYTPTGSDNIARMVTFRKFAEYPLYLIVGISREVYMADWRGDLAKSSFLMLLSIIVTTIAVRMVCRARQEEHNALERLVHQEEKYRIVAENTLAWEFWLDPKGHFAYTSPSCKQLTGYDADDYYSDPELFVRIVHPDDKEMFITHRHDVQRGDGDQEFLEFRIVRPDGSVLWFEHVCQPIFGKDGSFWGNRGCNRDITERIRAEHELQETQQQLANIIDFLPDATFVIDNDKKVIAWNRAMEEMSGVSKEQMLGQGDHAYTIPFYGERRNQLLDLLDINDEELASKYRQVVRKGETLFAEVEAPFLCNGKGAFLWASGAPLYSADNKRIGAIEIIRDISDKKKIEQDLLQAKHAAESSSRSKSEFLANMSHEIRTPMNAITGMAYLALQTNLDSRQMDYVTKIQQASESLLGIINDILDFSKIEAGKLELESIPFELSDLFEHLATLTGGRAEEKGLEVMFSLPVDLQLTLRGDPLRLGQVLGNLASNAVKFTERGHIIIAVEQAGPFENDVIPLTFSVQDTGIGMNNEQLAFVFEAFSQADNSITRRYGGTGLGLSIVTRLLRLMDATLEVESEPGRGSTFLFTIRIAVAEEQRQKQTDIPDDLRGLRVLVVDDNAAAREILSTMLTAFDFRVISVDSGDAALTEIRSAAAESDPYALVLMDWMMPDMDGFEAMRHIRGDRALIQPPAIIMVTAFGNDNLRKQVLQLEKTAFLTKPVQPSTLLNATLELFCKRGRQTPRQKYLSATHITGLQQISGARVLVVEDNSINQQIACEILEQAGISVKIAGNGREAVAAFEAGEKFDAVLMDIQMPVMDGYEASRRIRQIRNFSEIPIIAMTAYAMASEREECLASGMNDHVAKPVNPQALYASLITWIPPKSIGVDVETSPAADVQEEFKDDDTLPVSLPGLDIDTGLMRAGGNRQLYRKILCDFREQNLSVIEDLHSALKGNKHENMFSLLHSLKGLSATIGATTLAATVAEFERAITAGAGDAGSELISKLERQLAEVFEAVVTLGETRQSRETDITVKPLPKDELEALMKGLHESLNNNSLGAKKLFEGIKPHLCQPDRDKIGKHIDRLDYENAMTKLERTAHSLGVNL